MNSPIPLQIIGILGILLVLSTIALCIALGFENAKRASDGQANLDVFQSHIYSGVWWPESLALFSWITWKIQKHIWHY